jgi:hypothetical protein
MLWAGFEPTIQATNRPRPTPQTTRPLWPAPRPISKFNSDKQNVYGIFPTPGLMNQLSNWSWVLSSFKHFILNIQTCIFLIGWLKMVFLYVTENFLQVRDYEMLKFTFFSSYFTKDKDTWACSEIKNWSNHLISRLPISFLLLNF